MRAGAVGVGLIAAILLTDCNLAPTYKVPTTTVPVDFKEAAIWRPAQPGPVLPPTDWWRLYNDPLLDRLEAELATSNIDLAAEVAVYDQARAQAAEAEAGLFPQLTLGASLSANKQSANRPLRSRGQPSNYGANTLDATVQYEMDVWGRIRNQVAAGKAVAQATAAELATIRLSLEGELADQYLTLRGLDAQEQLLRSTVAAYRQALQIVRNRYAGKIASGMDVSRAETELENARAQLYDLASRRAVLEHAIAVLVGTPPALLSIPPRVVSLQPPVIPASLPSVLLQRRPDIAAAERRVAAANALIGVARAAFYPNISLSAVVGFQDTGLGLIRAPNNFWSVGPGLVLPLFEGGLLNAQEAAVLASYRLAVANYRSAVLTAFQEVEDNLARLHWLGQEAATTARAVAAAQRTLSMSMALYEDGATSYLDVATAQEAALQAEQSLLQVRTQILLASAGLIRALGGGWDARDLPAGPALTSLHAGP